MSPIWLWAHPRSRSTALERMMMERGDVTVLHEPLVSLLDEGRVSIPDGPTLSSVAAVVGYARSLPGPVFVKDTTEHRYTDHLTPELAAGITHTFVVREPSAAIASHVAVKPHASRSDIGYENQFRLFELAWSLAGTPPVVLDSDLLVRYPVETVRANCAAIGLPFRPEAMRWQAGDRPEWDAPPSGTWPRAAAPASSPPRRARRRYPAGHLRDYYAHHRPYYNRMLEHALSLSPSEAPR
jgi:Sulfotransferase domain